jgi:hypothetical protein
VISFTARLALRSMKWLGPAIIVLLWTTFTAASPGTALSNAANESLMLVAITCWLTVGIGNVDDEGHRELLAAAVGSPGRLHRDRAAAALVLANGLALVPTVAGIALAEQSTRRVNGAVIVITCVLVQLAATALGVGIGTLLHRPVVRNTGVALLVSIGALVGLVLLPPVQHVLRNLNDDRTGSALVASLVAMAIGIGAIAAAGALADRST